MSDMNAVAGGERANFGQRLGAALIDGIILGVVGGILSRLGAIGSLLNVLVGLAYYVYLEGSASGQTVGKKLLGIRVVRFDTGGELGYGGAAVRYLARFLSAIPCLLGYFWMLWDDQKQTWHDKLTSSIVVRDV